MQFASVGGFDHCEEITAKMRCSAGVSGFCSNSLCPPTKFYASMLVNVANKTIMSKWQVKKKLDL
jgi:hypothetical protein